VTLIEPSVKKYNVRLSPDERDLLAALVGNGKHPARKLLKARILLKADISEAGEGWSDSLIADALDTSTDTVYRTRQRLVEEGLEAAWPTNIRPARPGRAFSTAQPKRNSSPWPAASRRRADPDGPCSCWKSRWWN
jgi:hypothetical protein